MNISTQSTDGDGSFSIKEILFLMLIFVIPFFHWYSNVLIALLFLLSFYTIIKRKALPSIHIHWFLPTLSLYYIFSQLLSHGVWASMEKYLLLLAFPVLVALNPGFTRGAFLRKIYWSFVAGNLVAYFVCSARAIGKSISVENGQWHFTPNLVPGTTYDFLTSSIMGGNHFFGTDFSYFHHPSYYGMYLVFAQFLIFQLYKPSYSKALRYALIITFCIFYLALFQLSAKISILSSLGLSFVMLMMGSFTLRSKAIFVGLLLMLALVFMFANPRLKDFKDTLRSKNLIDPKAQYGYDLRILSWDASLTLIQRNLLLGVGEANKRNELVKVYKEKEYIVPAQQQLDSHNQYLDIFIGGGVFAFLLLIGGIIHLGYESISARRSGLTVLLGLYLFNMLVETFLGVHAGIFFFSVFVSLLSYRIGNSGNRANFNTVEVEN